jgi:hypothetical protein
VLCRTREAAESALARMRAWVNANGLTLHPDKTHIGDCRVEGQGFEFLGYRFEAGERWVYVLVTRRLYSPSLAGDVTPAAAPTRSGPMPTRSYPMAKCLLRRSWAFHDGRSPSIGVSIRKRKQLTGEPVAGKLLTGFGGRGRRQPFPTPIQRGLRRAVDCQYDSLDAGEDI